LKASTATAKGAATREMIVAGAYGIACRHGLEGLSIGDLAVEVGMSKSGVFAHFGSREELQLSVLDWSIERFSSSVLSPALAQPRGLIRLQAMMAGWFGWIRANADGCVFLAAAFEYDSCPGPLRNRIAGCLTDWRNFLIRAIEMAVDSGELAADTDPALLSFELLSLVQGFHHARLFDPGNADMLAQRSLARLLGEPRISSP
jgi:AcrR family transcriptional regulator